MNILERAIATADGTRNEGAGYALRVTLMTGEAVDVVAYRAEPAEHLFRRSVLIGEGSEIFFNPAAIATVEILW